MKNRVSPFLFPSYTEYLKAVRDQYGRRAKPVSLQIWAKRLGYRSARSLELILSGSRLPSANIIFQIAKDLKLSVREREYFELLVMKDRLLHQGRPTHELEKEMNRLRPARYEARYIGDEIFRRVSEWYPLVIRQLTLTPKFKRDIDWIIKKLRNKVTASQVRCALAEWEGLAFDRKSLYTPEDIPTHAVRLFHKKMLQKATEAIDEVPVHQREFISITFRSSSEKLEQMKGVLREMRDQIAKEFSSEEGDEVFQVTLGLFPHTDLVSKK